MQDVAAALATGEGREPQRMHPAIKAAEGFIRDWTARAAADEAVADFRMGISKAGAAVLDGADPQIIEDALYAASPQSPLAEGTLRLAWLALVDDLARSGDKPPFGGSGAAESWAFVARSRVWPHLDEDGQSAKAAALFGSGLHIVVVRGPGKSAFLADTRRKLLGAHGARVMAPAVIPASRDDLTGLLRPYIARSSIDPALLAQLDKLRFGEDLIGLLGRAGDSAPVALLLDDAHLQGRSVLLGLTLFVEPSPDRNALLVLAGPDDPAQDGPLAEVIADAKDRGILTEIALPVWDERRAGGLVSAFFGASAPADWAAPLAANGTESASDSDRMRCARAWLDVLTGDDGTAHPEGASKIAAGLDLEAVLPKHEAARRALSFAALEGDTFHAFALGAIFGKDEDWVEDLLHDDEFELEGEIVGGCEGAVPTGRTVWTDLPDGLHPVFRFGDPRISEALRSTLKGDDLVKAARGLRDALLNAYGPAAAWQIADRAFRLDVLGGQDRQVQQLLLGTSEPQRIEAGFRRLLPVLGAKTLYRLALARLYGASMEIGTLAIANSNVQLANQGFQAAAAAAHRLGRAGAAGEALARLAEVQIALALPTQAETALDQADTLLGQANRKQSLGRTGLLRAEAKVLLGQMPEAIALLRSGVEALEKHKDLGHAALGRVRLGRLLYEQGQVEDGANCLDEAIRLSNTSRDPRPMAAARMSRAFVFAEDGELDAAMKLLNEAGQAFQAARMPVAIVEVAAAGLQRRHGEPKAALERLTRVAEAFKKAGAAVQWADAWHEAARCHLDMESYTDAATMLAEVIKMRQRARDRFGLVRLYEDLGEALRGQGDNAGAMVEFSHARRLSERLGLTARMGRLDGAISIAEGALDSKPDLDAAHLRERGAAEIDELEALWKAGPQAQAADEKRVH